MNKNLSYVEQREKVRFPDFNNEKVYMLPFYKKDGLPNNLRHWQKTVDSMLDGINTDDLIYLMIDQGFVKANTYHRRPGVHIDGYWNPILNCHGNSSESNGGHITTPITHTHIHHNGGHTTTPNSNGTHNHNNYGGHNTRPKKRMESNNINYWEPEGLIIASNLTASRAWNGYYEGMPQIGGDCSHIDLSKLSEVEIKKDYSYCGNVTMLHESLLIKEDSYRTLVRLNVKNWTPETIH